MIPVSVTYTLRKNSFIYLQIVKNQYVKKR